jgi:hypothetical protein
MRIASAAEWAMDALSEEAGLEAVMNKALIGIAAFAILAASHPAFAGPRDAPRLFPKGNPTTVVHSDITDSLKRANTSIPRPHYVPESAGPVSLDDLRGRPPKVPCGQKVIC